MWVAGCWQLSSGHQISSPNSCSVDQVAAWLLFLSSQCDVAAVDCGDIYSGVEQLLGEAQRYLLCTHLVVPPVPKIHTKFVPDLEAIHSNCITIDYVRSCISRSCVRLGVGSLHLVQFHWWDYQFDYVPVLHSLYRLKREEQLIVHIGLTNFNQKHLLHICQQGFDVYSNQVQLSILDQRATEMLQVCRDFNVRLYCYGVLAGGFLTDSWLGKEEPLELSNRSLVKYKLIIDEFCGSWKVFQDLLIVLRTIADEYEADIAAVAVRYVECISDDVDIKAIIGSRAQQNQSQRTFDSLVNLKKLQKRDLVRINSFILERFAKIPQADDFYALERDRMGKHGAVMKYNLSVIGSAIHLEEILRRYIDFCCFCNPGYAASIGKSGMWDSCLRFDGRIEVEQETLYLKLFLNELSVIKKDLLDLDQKIDLELVNSDIHHRLVELEDVKSFQKDPNLYLPCGEYNLNIDGLSLQEITNLHSKLNKLPQVLVSGQKYLKQVPQEMLERAIRNAVTIQSLLVKLFEEMEKRCGLQYDDNLPKALTEFTQFLRDKLGDSSIYSGQIGKRNYEKLIKCYLHCDMSAEELIQFGETNFASILEKMNDIAAKIDAEKTWQQICFSIKQFHPSSDKLLEAYLSEFERARTFFLGLNIVPYPRDDGIYGFYTPDFLQEYSPFGDFLNPKPFSSQQKGHLMLNPIAEGPDAEVKLEAHDTAWLAVIAAHEAYPGHHLQFLTLQSNPRIFRKAYFSPLFYEGWGLYCEQLAWECGFFQKQEANMSAEAFDLVTRLTQLRLQLWRAARVILDAKYHCGLLSLDQCEEFLVEQVNFPKDNVRGEVNIYLHRPAYAPSYLLGYLQLLKLRKQLLLHSCDKSLPHSNFAPQDLLGFHSTILNLGTVPIPIIKRCGIF